MEPTTIKALVLALLTWLHTTAGYEIPHATPAVAVVPHAQLVEMACSASCAVLGFYRDDGVVYLDNRLAVETNVCAQSILLHELVHHLQHRRGRFAEFPPVIRWQLRELEAHGLQRVFLRHHGHRSSRSLPVTIGAATGPTC